MQSKNIDQTPGPGLNIDGHQVGGESAGYAHASRVGVIAGLSAAVPMAPRSFFGNPGTRGVFCFQALAASENPERLLRKAVNAVFFLKQEKVRFAQDLSCVDFFPALVRSVGEEWGSASPGRGWGR